MPFRAVSTLKETKGERICDEGPKCECCLHYVGKWVIFKYVI